MARETLCTVSIAVASRLYSSSVVIKILPMTAGTNQCVWCGGGGNNQLCVPVVLTLLLLCKSAYLHANTAVSEEA